MDEFAKWARVKRSLDKKSSEYDSLSTAQAMSRAGFEVKANIAIRAVVMLLHMALLWMHHSEAMLHLPERWVGGLGSILALPFSPTGITICITRVFYFTRLRITNNLATCLP